ncbi:MAG: LUD domain-containing protein [Bacteroidia bacterium]|nr:LUD domain-containing protein [Bacteroidia bacterium]
MEHQTTSKEKILKKVRQALNYKSKSNFQNIDLESNVFTRPEGETLAEAFVKKFAAVSGQFVYCDNQFDCIDKLLDLIEQRKWKYLFSWEDEIRFLLSESGIPHYDKKDNLEKIQASVTGCESLLASSGSILVSSTKNSRTLTIWPPVHIVIAKRSQIVLDIKESFQQLRNRYGRNMPSLLTFITGPSRTSNLPPLNHLGEPVEVIGAHGPIELILFLIDDRKHD